MKIIQLFLILLIVTFIPTSNATENKVYINQVGDSNTVTIDQIGDGNNVGGYTGTIVSVAKVAVAPFPANFTTINPLSAPSSSNYAVITGNSNKVALSQAGDNNWIQYNITGDSNEYTHSATGNDNVAILSIITPALNNVSIPTGKPSPALGNKIAETISGDGNFIMQTINGHDINSSYTISGAANQVTTSLESSYGLSDTTITGGNNILFNNQSGVGFHELTQDIIGSNNSVTTQQIGGTNTSIDIKINGDFNTITVRSSDAAGIPVASQLTAMPQ